MTTREQLIRDIEAAFRSVERGNGMTYVLDSLQQPMRH